MENKQETNLNHEQLEKKSKITLHFFRHAEPERDPNKSNQAFELTETGRQQAIEKSKKISGKKDLSRSAVIGSPRRRTQQTAAFAMVGDSLDTVTGEESFEELKKK